MTSTTRLRRSRRTTVSQSSVHHAKSAFVKARTLVGRAGLASETLSACSSPSPNPTSPKPRTITMGRYINRLFHVCITVPDIDEALAFYQDVLGLESIGSLRNERSDGAVLGFPGREIVIHANHLRGKHADNAPVIDLIEFVEPDTVVGEGPYGQMNHVGITRMAFDVDDTDAI